MPQREQLSAPLLGALFVVAGAASGWLLFALEALVQGGAGAAAGFPWEGVALTPPLGLPSVRQGLEGVHGPGGWAVLLLAGPLVGLAATAAAHGLAEALATPGWVRALGFEAFAKRFVGGDFAVLLDRVVTPGTGSFTARALGLAFAIALAGFFYRRKIFLRV